MGIVRGTVRVVAAMLLAITTLAVLAQPASAEPDVQIGKVCSDAGNRRIRLKQDTDLLIQWFLDGTPYLEPSTDQLILTTVPGDGTSHVIELKHMPDKIVIATFEVTFEKCDESPATTKPPTATSTTPSTTVAPTTSPPTTTASTAATTATSATPTTIDSASTSAPTTTEAEPLDDETGRDDTAIAADGAALVLGALTAIAPEAESSDTLSADETTAQTLTTDLISPSLPFAVVASDDPAAGDAAEGTTGSSMRGLIVIAVIGAVAAGLIGLVIGRRGGASATNAAAMAVADDEDSPDAEALPSAQELLAARSGAARNGAAAGGAARSDNPLPKRQRSTER